MREDHISGHLVLVPGHQAACGRYLQLLDLDLIPHPEIFVLGEAGDAALTRPQFQVLASGTGWFHADDMRCHAQHTVCDRVTQYVGWIGAVDLGRAVRPTRGGDAGIIDRFTVGFAGFLDGDVILVRIGRARTLESWDTTRSTC